jgi:hypothetical protein
MLEHGSRVKKRENDNSGFFKQRPFQKSLFHTTSVDNSATEAKGLSTVPARRLARYSRRLGRMEGLICTVMHRTTRSACSSRAGAVQLLEYKNFTQPYVVT